MAEFPALPIFTDALLADTEHLSDEEFGAYTRLLIVIWRSPNCQIPNDEEWIMRRLKVDAEKFNRLQKKLIKEFLTTSGNFLTQKRLLKEFNYLRRKRGKNSANAKVRWNKDKSTCNGMYPTPPKAEDKSSAVDFKKVIFDEGLRWISGACGRTPTTMRSLLGKWCRDYGDAAVAAAMIKAQGSSPIEPISFVEKILKEMPNAKTRNAAAPGNSKSERFKRELVDATLDDLAADERPGGQEAACKPFGPML